MRRTALLFLAASFALPACQADDDEAAGPTGTYEVQSHTRTDMTCEGAGEAVQGETELFALELDNFFGATVLGWHDCTSATDCEEESDLFRSFVEEDGRWVLRSTFASGIESCSGSIEEGSTVQTDDGVRIEIRSYSGTIDLEAGEECDTDLVDAHFGELDCTTIEVIEARAV